MSLLVLDTNFVLDRLDLVQELVATHATFSHIVLVPKMVLVELDRLKTREDQRAARARTANRYVKEELGKQTPGIRGQRHSEFVQPHLSGDEAILDCCLYFADQAQVVLLSNDVNLCAKALANNVKTVSAVQGITASLIGARVAVAAGVMSVQAAEALLGMQPAAPGALAANDATNVETDMDMEMADAPVSRAKLPDATMLETMEFTSVRSMEVSILHNLMLNASHLIEYYMSMAYPTEDLEFLGYKKPGPDPSLYWAAGTIKKFSVAVFSEILPRSLIKEAAESSRSRNFDKQSFEQFVDLWGSIVLHLGQSRSDYKACVRRAQQALHEFYN